MSSIEHQNPTNDPTEIKQGYESDYDSLLSSTPGLEEFIRSKKEALNNPKNLRESGSYLGSGSDKDVFEFNGMAIKFAREHAAIEGIYYGEPIPATSFQDQIKPLQLGKGVPHLEQLLAASESESVIITTLAPGKTVYDTPGRQLLRISSEQINALRDTLRQMEQRGLHYHNLGGIFYDSAEGFSFVDYETNDSADELRNQGDQTNTSEFLAYILADQKKFDDLERARIGGGPRAPKEAYTTTGIRGIARSRALKKLQKLIANDKAADA